MLGYDGKIKTKKSGEKLTISIPALTPANNPCDYAWVYKLENVF